MQGQTGAGPKRLPRVDLDTTRLVDKSTIVDPRPEPFSRARSNLIDSWISSLRGCSSVHDVTDGPRTDHSSNSVSGGLTVQNPLRDIKLASPS
jgi:hypothetical protein